MDDDSTIGDLSDVLFLLILFVFYIPEYLLYDILKSDDPIYSSMLIKDERYVLMGFLEYGEYTINRLSGWNLDDLFEVEFFQFLVSESFFLPYESFSQIDDIVDIIRSLSIDRYTRVRRAQEKCTELIDRHFLWHKIHRYPWSHDRRGFGIGEIEDILDLLVLMGFHDSLLMRDIEKRLEFLGGHSFVVQIDMSACKKTHESDKVFYEPVKGKEEYHKDTIHRSHKKRYLIGKSNSENLWGYLSEQENDGRNEEKCAGHTKLSRKMELLGKIESYQSRETRDSDGYSGRTYEVRHEKTFILRLDRLKRERTEPVLLDCGSDDVIGYRHERDFSSCKKYEEDEEDEKYAQ